jgi:glycosyltransferase involved in cell wall biosynthesis
MLNEQPPVTWLMPVKNGMPYLPATLDSIANQSYRNHLILARDDGSTDGTLDELKRWIPSRIPGQVFSGPSQGVGRSLAFLVAQAGTEFCARIDGDDVNMPHRLERQVEFLLSHPEVGVVGSHVRTIDENGAEQELWQYETSDAEIRWLNRYASRLCHPAVMFRRSLVLASGNYQDFVYEDADLWLRMTLLAEMRNLPEVLLHYRRTNTSVTGTVHDWVATLRRAAEFNASRLFPGLTNTTRVMELWQATLPLKFGEAATRVPSRYWHLKQLRRSAILLAEQCRRPRNYFIETESFNLQYFSLKRRVLSRFGLRPLLDLRDYFKGINV